MNDALPPEIPCGVAGALALLRHALADPLSAAGLKLELLERRLSADPSLAERVRGAKADLGIAGRLIDLLPRLATLAGEAPSETSIDDACRLAGIPLADGPGPFPRLLLRRLATIDALRSVATFLRPPGPAGPSPLSSVESTSDRVSLRIEAPAPSGETNLERLFHLPRGEERAEGLYLARAAVESDGGRLELVEEAGLAVALLSWPRPATPRDTGGAA